MQEKQEKKEKVEIQKAIVIEPLNAFLKKVSSYGLL